MEPSESLETFPSSTPFPVTVNTEEDNKATTTPAFNFNSSSTTQPSISFPQEVETSLEETSNGEQMEIVNVTAQGKSSTTPTSNFNSSLSIKPTIYLPSAEVALFEEIPKEIQMEMVHMIIRNKTIHNEVLLNSLKFSKNLTRLDIHNCSLDSGFDAIEDLPEIREYILTDAYFQERPKNFQEYFPFFKGATLDLADFPKVFNEVNIDDGVRRFILKPSQGIIVVSNFANFKVDKILTGLPSTENPDFEWKRVILEEVEFSYNSIPSSLVHLRLSNVNISREEMSKLLKKVPDLEILGVHELGERELELRDLPNKSLKYLRLDRSTLNHSPPEGLFYSFFTHAVPTFVKLEQFYWGLDVILDDKILTNFDKIFPNVRQAAYFGPNNLTILNTLLGLKDLELLYLRIHEIRAAGTQKIMDRINFVLANSTVGPNIDIIHVCVERKSGETDFSSRYLGSGQELLDVNGKFHDGVDVLECQGFDA